MKTASKKPRDKIVKASWSRDAAGNPVKTVRHQCRSPHCKHLVDHKKEHSPFCARHRTVRFKEKFPLKYSFNKLKQRAKERGKAFSLTYAEYEGFAIKTDYARLKGKTSLSLSIDRVDNSRGYEAGNIAALTLRENSRKQFVPYFAKQMENTNYKPSADEIAAVQNLL